MRKRATTVGTALVALISFALTGCVPSTPHVIPTAEPTATPVFASDADALAAAKKAYEGYNAVSDQIARDGGRDTSSMGTWETPRQYTKDAGSFDELKAKREHTSGRSSFSHLTLQRRAQNSDGTVTVDVYVCLDISKVRLLDTRDRDVTPKRPNILPLQLAFVSDPASSNSLLLDGSQVWSGSNYC